MHPDLPNSSTIIDLAFGLKGKVINSDFVWEIVYIGFSWSPKEWEICWHSLVYRQGKN
jgi:hypothetical protein